MSLRVGISSNNQFGTEVCPLEAERESWRLLRDDFVEDGTIGKVSDEKPSIARRWRFVVADDGGHQIGGRIAHGEKMVWRNRVLRVLDSALSPLLAYYAEKTSL